MMKVDWRRNYLRLLILLLTLCAPTAASFAKTAYGNPLFDISKGTIDGNGVLTVNVSGLGTMQITNVSYVYYEDSQYDWYMPWIKFRSNSSAEIRFKFDDPNLFPKELYGHAMYWVNKTILFVSYKEYHTGAMPRFPAYPDDGGWYRGTFDKVSDLRLNGVYLWWDPLELVKQNKLKEVTKTYSGSNQQLVDIDPLYHKWGYSGRVQYNSPYDKNNWGALTYKFNVKKGNDVISTNTNMPYGIDPGFYKVEWWYEGANYDYCKYSNGTWDRIYTYVYSGYNKEDPIGDITSEIKALPLTDVVPPEGKELQYTGEPQALITAATCPNGQAQYLLGDTWSTEIPVGTNAGRYAVYWYVKSTNIAYEDYGSTWEGSRKGPIVVTIAKANIPESSYTPSQPRTLTYNSQEQALISAGSVAGDIGQLWYRLGTEGTWTTDVTAMKAKEAGSYTIYWYIKGDDNHNDVGSREEPAGSVNAVIQSTNFALNSVTWSGRSVYTYDGQPHLSGVTLSGLPTFFEATYTVKDASYNNVDDGAVNVGTYTVTATITSNSPNYNDPASMSTTFTIEPYNLQMATASAIADKVYRGTVYEPADEVTLKDGDWTIPSDAYTATYLNNINVGTATMTLTANNANFTGSKAVRFNISKRPVHVATANQEVVWGESLKTKDDENFLASLEAVDGNAESGPCTGHSVMSVILTATNDSYVKASDMHIQDGSGAEVTSNYTISYPPERRGTLSVTAKNGEGLTVLGLNDEYLMTDDMTSVEPSDVAVFDGNTRLTAGTDYTVAYSQNDKAGKATATFTLNGNYTGEIKKSFNIYYTTETFSRKAAPSYNYCTYYNRDEKLKVRESEAAVFVCELNDAKTDVDLQAVTAAAGWYIINQDTPVMLRTGSTVSMVKLYAAGESETSTYPSATNALTGVGSAGGKTAGSDISPDTKHYVFDGEAFVWAIAGTYTAHRAYIDGIGLSASRLAVVFADGEATGFNEELRMKNEESDLWYDLMGNRIAKPTRKGLYIHNGRKEVIR